MPTGPNGRFLPRFDPKATDRTCRDCGETKPLEEFKKDKSGTAGRGSNCKPCHNATMQRHYRENIDRERERSRTKNLRRYYEQPEVGNPWVPTQRARQYGVHIEDPHLLRLVVLELDDGVCGICGEDVDPFDFHCDHIVPCSKGGEHSYANLQVAHPLCNQRKNEQVLLDA